jgi:hypothetical protein
VINKTPEYIDAYTLEVAEANSWSKEHRTFLPNRAFPRQLIDAGKNLEPSTKSNAKWVIRMAIKENEPSLLVGSNNHILKWPNNDPSTIEVWRLTFGVSYESGQLKSKNHIEGLSPAHLFVRWNREHDTLLFAKHWDEPELAS